MIAISSGKIKGIYNNRIDKASTPYLYRGDDYM